MKTTLTILAAALALGILTGGSAQATGLAPTLAKSHSGITQVTWGKLSPWHVKRKLLHRGFRHIRITDGRGRIYGFVARKWHRLYKIRINAYSGYVVSVNRIYFRRHHRRHRWY